MADIRITNDSIGIEAPWIVTEHDDVIVWMATIPKGTELAGVSGGIIILSSGDKFVEIGIAGLELWTTFSEVSRCTLMVCSVRGAMPNDWDWADHKAIGVLSVVTQMDEIRPVKESWFWYAEQRHEDDAVGHAAVADALREAYEAGRANQRQEDAEVARRTEGPKIREARSR